MALGMMGWIGVVVKPLLLLPKTTNYVDVLVEAVAFD